MFSAHLFCGFFDREIKVIQQVKGDKDNPD